MEKRITLAAIVFSLCGLLSEFLDIRSFGFLKMNLRLIDAGLSRSFTVGEIDFWNISFCCIFLFSALLYYFSKYKESRLLAFFFSLVFLSKAASLFISIIYWIAVGFGGFFLNSVGYFFIVSAFIIVSYWSIKELRNKRSLEIEIMEYGESRTELYLPATNWQRIFHLYVDLIASILIFYPIVRMLIDVEATRSWIRILESALTEYGALCFLIIFFRSIFYITFEAVFNATPAKLLTETKVTDENGNPPLLSQIIGRTFSRYMPFEPLSFLANSGWHDRWSRTEVLQLKRTGIKGGYYFLLVPIVLFASLGYYVISTAWKEQQQTKKYEAEFADQVREFDRGLKNINTNTVIALKDVDYGPTMYIKAEDIKKDSIVFAIIEKDQSAPKTSPYAFNSIGQQEIEPIYKERQNKLTRVPIARVDLAKAVVRQSLDYSDRGVNLLKVGKGYRIESIDDYFMPRLKLSDTYQYSKDNKMVSLENWGWPAEIIAIKGDSKDIVWKFSDARPMPIQIKQNDYFSLTANGKEITEFKVRVTLRDTLNRIQVYEITGHDEEMPKMKRIK